MHDRPFLMGRWPPAFPAQLLLGCSILQAVAAPPAVLTVSAAASLTDSLQEIGVAYEKQTGVRVLFNLGASSFLARQIEQGAPADIFFSADEARMDGLEKNGLIIPETRRSRLSNSLVVVVETNNQLQLRGPRDLASPAVKRIALADPATVPAGIYAKAYLEKLGLWSALRPKVVPAENVRAALSAVASGNVEAGIVYKTDAAISTRVKIAYEVPSAETPAISYSMAVLKESIQPEGAREFLNYLGSEQAGRVFTRFGFIVRP